MQTLDRFVTVTQAAHLLGMSAENVVYHAKVGHLRTIRDPGGNRLVERASVEAFVAQRQRATKQKAAE